MKNVFSIALIFILFSGFFGGCKKDKGDPPVLPPLESMNIDFSNFASAKKSGELLPAQKGTANSNWEYAAAVAGVWNVIIKSTLAVPVLAFKTAIEKTPVYVSTKNWQWSFNITFQNVTYKARLTGLIGSTEVQWKMYISNDGTGGFTEFLWFEGTSKIDGSGGQWILYQSVLVPDTLLRIDWTKTANKVGYVKYSYVKNDTFKNSFIEYGLTTSTTLDAYYTIHNSLNGTISDVNVEWSTATGIGHVKSQSYLGDTNWYCWNTEKINTVCP